MTVQQLIDRLLEITSKDQEVKIPDEAFDVLYPNLRVIESDGFVILEGEDF